MSDCTECGWPVATDADNDRPCDDHCDHCRGLCWHEFTGVHRDDVRPDATIATLTHRAEAAERELSEAELRRLYAAVCRGQTRSDDARAIAQAVIDEYVQTAEQCDRNDTLLERMGESRSLCIEALRGVQATGDVDAQTWDVVADGIAALRVQLSATQDAYEGAGYEAYQCANERDAARFLRAGWRRLAEDKRDDAWAWMRAHNEAALARDAALANADAVLSTAEALRVERDDLRAKLARAEGVVADIEAALASRQSKGLHVPHELDAVPVSALRHIQRQLKAALATYEEG